MIELWPMVHCFSFAVGCNILLQLKSKGLEERSRQGEQKRNHEYYKIIDRFVYMLCSVG